MRPAIKRKGKPLRAVVFAEVDQLVKTAEELGLVAADEDAAAFIPKDDPRVVRAIQGGSSWAKYTLLLNDQTVYQDGGQKRCHWVAPAVKQQWIIEAAGRSIANAATMYELLRLYRRATVKITGQTEVEAALGNDPALLNRLA